MSVRTIKVPIYFNVTVIALATANTITSETNFSEMSEVKNLGGSDLIPLEEALYFGNINMIRDLIEYKADVYCIHHIESGETVIHRTVKFNRSIDMIGLLMRNYKANINIVSFTKKSLLYYAITIRSLTTAQYFIKLGIEVNLENSDGDTTLQYAGYYLNAVKDSIKKRVVNLRAAGCYVSKKNLLAVDWESPCVKSFYDKCFRRIELISILKH
ncbi:hypothetical protein KQX54_019002 [Cotesia glomerata]|uniref:Uncharacterized protein n=1 Tax=Cotesia glomerata TaxID=32391 RepID=A0AAV7I4B3_COTGL|nr:hypothetical protein KQX54_019002 [Cotesia glomerata]